MRNSKPRKDRRKKNGGSRPGCGRKPSSNERIWAWISRDTRVKLDRFARSIGLNRDGNRKYWAKIFDALAGKVDLPEPEYLTLARAITVRTAR